MSCISTKFHHFVTHFCYFHFRHGSQDVRRAADGSIDNSFTVPKNIELDLRLRVIEPFNVVVLRFYSEYRWLVDFSVIAFVVYLLTEAWLYQDGELNLSLIWVAMLAGFTMYPLSKKYYNQKYLSNKYELMFLKYLIFNLLSLVSQS